MDRELWLRTKEVVILNLAQSIPKTLDKIFRSYCFDLHYILSILILNEKINSIRVIEDNTTVLAASLGDVKDH